MSRTTMRHGWGTLLAVTVAVLSLIAASLAIPRTANAVQTPGFTVSNIVVAGQSRDTNTRMTFDWSAESMNRAPQPGEGFELQLPPQLVVAGNSRTTKPITYAGKNVGECVFGAEKISCTFNDAIAEFANKTDVKGSAELEVVASNAHREAYTDTTINFMFNGEAVPGQIPTGIAAAKAASFSGTKFSKYATPIGDGQKFIPWVIDFNPTVLNQAYPDKYATPDKNGNITFEIKDTVGAGYDLTALENSPWSLLEANSAQAPGATATRLTDTTGRGSDPRFSMTVVGTGNERTITLTGPFKAETNYRLAVPAKLAGGAVSGVDYTNEAELVGTTEKILASRNFINAAKVTIEMKAGYGGIRLVKAVKGPAAAQVPTTTEFTMKLNYTLPEGKTPTDFPDWGDKKGPEVVDGANTGTVTLKVPVGSWTNYGYLFPVGTTFTFDEEFPTVANVAFDRDKIVFKPTTATIANRQMSEIEVTNQANVSAGTFKVKKVVQAPAGDANFTAPANVTVQYQCGDSEGVKEIPTDGTAVEIGKFPVGVDCKILDESGDDVDGYTVVASGLNEAVTIASGDDNIATVTNTYARSVGGFKVVKAVAARDGVVVDPAKEFEFTYTCTKAGAPDVTDTVTATAGDNGAAVVNNIPVGYSCAVVENEAKAKEGVENANLAVVVGSEVTIEKDKVAEIAVTNTFSKANSQFKIVKQLNDEAPAAAKAHAFSFQAICTKDNQEVVNKKVTITGAGEVVVADVPVGAKCVVTEDTDAAKIDGYNLVATVNGGEFTQAVAENIVDVSNVYTKQVGGFKVVKAVAARDGVVVDPAKEFEFTYTCTKAGAPDVTDTVTATAGDNGAAVVNNIPVGYSCAVVENEAKAKEGVENANLAVVVGSEVTIEKDKVAEIAVTNTFSKANSQFKIVKQLNDEAPAAAKAHAFSFQAICTKDNQEVVNKKVTITGAGEVVVADVPVGAKCVVTEDTDAAKIDGYNLVATVNGGEFTQAVAENIVDVSNVYTKQVGTFTVIKKLVDKDGVAAAKNFEFEYTCTNDKLQLSGTEAAGTFTLGAGEQKQITDIPAGSVCKIVEKDAGVAGADLTTSGITDVTIVENANEEVTVTNDYAAWRGTVDLTKELTGSAKDLAAVKALEFEVDYTCTLGSDVKNGTVKVTPGKTVEIGDLRSGAQCEFTEKTDAIAAPDGTQFNKDKSEATATVTVGAKETHVAVKLSNDFTELGKVALTKEVSGLAAGSSDNKTREYDVEASWTSESGEKVTNTLKISAGKNTELPALPVGTVITLKEIMPADGILTNWDTPSFSSDVSGVVKDNGDGTATVTVPADSFTKPAVVKITNSANIPWWWIIVPFIPVAIVEIVKHFTPKSPAPVAPAAPATADPSAPAKKGIAKTSESASSNKSNDKTTGSKSLAQTGASVLGLLVFAALLVALGVFLVRRGRTKN